MRTFKIIYCTFAMIISILEIGMSLLYTAAYEVSFAAGCALVLFGVIATFALLGFAEVLDTEC